jgi:hypothetical protein
LWQQRERSEHDERLAAPGPYQHHGDSDDPADHDDHSLADDVVDHDSADDHNLQQHHHYDDSDELRRRWLEFGRNLGRRELRRRLGLGRRRLGRQQRRPAGRQLLPQQRLRLAVGAYFFPPGTK